MTELKRIITEKDELLAKKDKEIAELKEKNTKLQNQLDGIAKLLNGKKKKQFLSCSPKNKVNRYALKALSLMQ